MSSGGKSVSVGAGFGRRFAEVCGTSKPAEIQRLLNISYQAAKNYLNGRLPEARVLITVAERTPYSVHWLLTGEGEKFSIPASSEDTLPLARQLGVLIRQEVQRAVSESLERPSAAEPRKTIILRADELQSEAPRELPVRSPEET